MLFDFPRLSVKNFRQRCQTNHYRARFEFGVMRRFSFYNLKKRRCLMPNRLAACSAVSIGSPHFAQAICLPDADWRMVYLRLVTTNISNFRLISIYFWLKLLPIYMLQSQKSGLFLDYFWITLNFNKYVGFTISVRFD